MVEKFKTRFLNLCLDIIYIFCLESKEEKEKGEKREREETY